MIAPGHSGSEIFEVARYHPFARAIYGPVLEQSGIGRQSYSKQLPPRIDFELGVIAGGISLDPFAYMIAPEPQDGRVSVESTRIDGMRDHIVLPTSHELLAHHPLTVMQVIHFLRAGRFLHDPFGWSASAEAA